MVWKNVIFFESAMKSSQRSLGSKDGSKAHEVLGQHLCPGLYVPSSFVGCMYHQVLWEISANVNNYFEHFTTHSFTKTNLRSFVWDFGQEYNQTITLEDIEDYMMTAALHPAQVSPFQNS